MNFPSSKHMRIFTTSQWAFVISTAKVEKSHFEVTEMVTANFRDFKAATKDIIKMDIDTNKENVTNITLKSKFSIHVVQISSHLHPALSYSLGLKCDFPEFVVILVCPKV